MHEIAVISCKVNRVLAKYEVRDRRVWYVGCLECVGGQVNVKVFMEATKQPWTRWLS